MKHYRMLDSEKLVSIQRTDVSVSLAHGTTACPGGIREMDACAGSIAEVKAQLLARSDAADRIARVEMLKAQVDAGTYIIDSRAIAQKMQPLPAMCALLGDETNDISLLKQEDEPHE